ncbi:MAG TPA: DUF2961 domain-containing protein [Puia sp.]
MRSTYDRDGGNESADASHFLYAAADDQYVTLDVKGTGVLYFFRANHWHGSPWHFAIDGKDNIVRETGTSDPVNAKKVFQNTSFIPEPAFPKPLNWTWSTTKGADLIWSPMPFTDSLRIAYSRTRYGTGYYIYQLYANKDRLSRPIQSWNSDAAPEQAVVDLLSRAGTDIAPQGISKKIGSVKLDRGNILLTQIKAGRSVIRALKLNIPLDKAVDLERMRLVVKWDGAEQPSIDAPLCLFFGTGTLFNREKKEFLVKGLPINIRYDYEKNRVELSCYYPMPFFREAKIELAGITPVNASIDYEVRYEPDNMELPLSSYFHATYKDVPEPAPGMDMTYLDTKGIEGQQDWSGSFVGGSFIFSHTANLGTLEGDPRFFFDDSQTPQAYGTGTEEWGGGGDYWGGENMTLPLAGHPCGARTRELATGDKDLVESAYRFLFADIMPFGKRAVIRFEHGGENLSAEHYEAVSYWYGLPAASLIKTDSVDIGNEASEGSHNYTSPEASPVQTLESRYEWGIDVFPAKVWGMDAGKMPGYQQKAGAEIYPAHREDGRFTRGTSMFKVRLASGNRGVLLRRTLDYSFPNQTAKVYIATKADPQQTDFQPAGIWYLAGSNTSVYSDPPGELDKARQITKTSNRRFRDDEFMIPAILTSGASSITVKIVFIPNGQTLLPEFRFPKESAWSELRYEVYSYVIPTFGLPSAK